MCGSGLTLQERPGAKKKYEGDGPDGPGWTQYKRWTERTSILIPFPPQVYALMPTILKRTLFLEFPLYVFDPAKHADGKKEREAEEGRGSESTQVAEGGRQGSQDALKQGGESES